MKRQLNTLKKNLFVLALLGLFFFSSTALAQNCINCDGDKTTCGELGCDYECPDCEGPSIQVDNGVWILLTTGVLAVVFFATKNKSLIKLSSNNPS
jgi:hypothetical protein